MSFAQKSLVLLALPVLFLPGCGKQNAEAPEVANRKHELTELYDMYSLYVKTNQEPPHRVADLATDANRTIYTAGSRILENGEYLFAWGVDISSKDSNTVLAYPKDGREEGGFALMADGSVHKMTADELRSVLPAKP
jgi:hypothetical protein